MEYKKLQLEKFSSAFFLWFSLVALFLLSYYEIAFFFPCCYCCLVTQFRPTLFDPLDCSPPGFSVHGISQARILAWVVIPFSGDLPDPGIELGRGILYHWATREAVCFSHSCLTKIVQKGLWNQQYCKIQLADKVWALSFYVFLCILKFLIFYHHIFDWNFCWVFFQRRCYNQVLVWWQITADNSIIKYKFLVYYI